MTSFFSSTDFLNSCTWWFLHILVKWSIFCCSSFRDVAVSAWSTAKRSSPLAIFSAGSCEFLGTTVFLEFGCRAVSKWNFYNACQFLCRFCQCILWIVRESVHSPGSLLILGCFASVLTVRWLFIFLFKLIRQVLTPQCYKISRSFICLYRKFFFSLLYFSPGVFSWSFCWLFSAEHSPQKETVNGYCPWH